MHTCIWLSWCHCHSLSLASVKSRLVLPFWYGLTWVVLDKGPLNGCVCVCVCISRLLLVNHNIWQHKITEMQLSWNTNLPVVSYRQIRLGSRHDGVWWASSHYRSVSRRFIWCSCTSWHISTLRCSSSLSNDWLCSTAKPLHMSDVRRHSDCSTSTRSLSFCFFSLQHIHSTCQWWEVSIHCLVLRQSL